MWYDFQSRIYGFDGMFPRTFRDLTLRPGLVAKDYIRGNRIKYYGPVGYFFLMVTLFILIMSILEINFSDYSAASQEAFGGTSSGNTTFEKELQTRTSTFIGENMRIFSFAVVMPVVLMTWLFFRKSGYNSLQHAVISFYVFGHAYWMTILSLFLFKVTGVSARITIQFIITILYFAFACSNFYTHNSRTKAFFKGLGAFILGYLIFMIVVASLGIIYVLTDSEMQEMIRNQK